MTGVAVVGVGRIGAPLVARLVAAGHDVVGTDVRPECRHDVEASGAVWQSDTARAVAGRGVVFTSMPGSPELRDLVVGPGQLLSHLDDGAVWVDLTSASPEVGRECASAAKLHGTTCLEAPIGGGVHAMRDGTVTLYVGGDAEVLAEVAPVLRSFAAIIHHVGDLGAGYLMKLLINLLWFGQVALTTEALLLGRHHGLSPDRIRELLLGSAGDSAFVARHLPALLDGDYLADFGLDRCVEELDAIERDAERAGTPHPVTSVVAELHRLALRHFGAVDGELMAAAWLEVLAGTTVRRGGP